MHSRRTPVKENCQKCISTAQDAPKNFKINVRQVKVIKMGGKPTQSGVFNAYDRMKVASNLHIDLKKSILKTYVLEFKIDGYLCSASLLIVFTILSFSLSYRFHYLIVFTLLSSLLSFHHTKIQSHQNSHFLKSYEN